MSGDEERALAHGFDAYLSKPYEPPEVVSLVRKLLIKQRDEPGPLMRKRPALDKKDN